MKEKDKRRDKEKKAVEKPSAGIPYHAALPVAACLWAALAAWYYLQNYPINLDILLTYFSISGGGSIFGLIRWDYFRDAGIAIAVLIAAFGWGKRILGFIGFEERFAPLSAMYATGVGLALIIYAVLAAGFLGMLYAALIGALLVVGIGFAVHQHYSVPAAATVQKNAEPSEGAGFLPMAFLCVSAIGILYAFIAALAPETFYDSLVYHLALPKMWVQHHRIFSYENLGASYYPANIHLVFLTGLFWGSEVAAKLLNFGMGMCATFTIYAWARSRFSKRAAVISTGIFLSIPFAVLLLTRTAIEPGLAFFETLSVISFLSFLEAPEKRSRLILAALFCGTAVGGKYLSGYCFIALSAVMVYSFVRARRPVREMALDVALLGLIVLALASPYLVRNYHLKGVATYPYGVSVSTDVTLKDKGKTVDFSDPGRPDRSLKNFVTLPWYMTMGKKTQEPFCGGMLLALLPLPFLFRKTDDKLKYLAIYVLGYYLCWFGVRTYFRYVIPLMPAAALLFGCYLSETKMHAAVRGAVLCILTVLGLSTLTMTVSSSLISATPWPVVSGGQTKRDYLATTRPSYPNPYYQSIEWANQNLPQNATVLFLGESRGFYSERKFVNFGVSDVSPLVTMVQAAKTPEEFRGLLAQRGITHILLNAAEARRQASYDIVYFEPQDLVLFSRFWQKYMKELYREPGDIADLQQGLLSMRTQKPEMWERYKADPFTNVYIYEILSEADANQPHQPPANLFAAPHFYVKERWEKIASTLNIQAPR